MMTGPVPQTPQPPTPAFRSLAAVLPEGYWMSVPPAHGTAVTVVHSSPTGGLTSARVDVPFDWRERLVSALAGSEGVVSALAGSEGVVSVRWAPY